jgi:hypothetical protein
MEGEKTTVNTPDGPVQYVFEGTFPKLEDSPVIPRKKKEKKPKKPKKITVTPWFHLVLIYLLLALIGSYLIFPRATPDGHPGLVAGPGHNTTSLVVEGRIEHNVKSIFQILRTKTSLATPVVCMHHLNIPGPYYRICAVYVSDFDMHLLLVNPKAYELCGKKVPGTEKSIACPGTTQKNRYNCVKISYNWGQMTGDFIDEVAMALQMVMDEFNGNEHC